MSKQSNFVTGKISKVVNDKGIQYGFVKVPKVGEVFFSLKTDFEGTSFEDLTVGSSVKVVVVKTDRGLFAKQLKNKVTTQAMNAA